MATNYLKWERLRSHRTDLSGRFTSKDGLRALDLLGVTLMPGHTYLGAEPADPVNATLVHLYGRDLGYIRHTGFVDRGFSGYVNSVYRMTENGPIRESQPLGAHPTHDAAVTALLLAHGVRPPVPTLAERMGLSVVSGPARHTRTHRAYEGKKAAPDACMGTAARMADATATRIRMNAARTNPLTGEKVSTSTKAVRAVSDPGRPITVVRLKKVYGHLMTIHRRKATGPTPTIDRHLSALALSPEYHHVLVRNSMACAPGWAGGIHVGDKHATDMIGTLARDLHHGGKTILKDRTNSNVGGVYFGGDNRQMVVPEDTNLSGSHSTASHELGHALDQAYGAQLSGRSTLASELPHFQQVYREVLHLADGTEAQLNAYYTEKSTGKGYKEMWAEGYAAWLHGRRKYRTADEQDMLIGHELGAAPADKLRVGRILRRYFDIQDEKMRELVDA